MRSPVLNDVGSMKKLTSVQKVTVGFLVLYIGWEILVQIWANSLPPSDPVIRADLLIIYPLLILLIGISLIQFIKRS